MNLDKLKSLIRLANNNPSENEANLAARKVCKLLAENDFKLLNGSSHQPQQQNRTWNGVKRSTEPFYRPSRAQSDFYERNRQQSEAEKRVWDWFKNGKYSGVDWDSEAKGFWEVNIPFTGEQKTKPPKKMRVCTECGLEKETRNTGLYYICASCHWKKYHETKKESD